MALRWHLHGAPVWSAMSFFYMEDFMNFWTALHTIGKLARFLPDPQIMSVTAPSGEVIYAINCEHGVQYDLLRNDGAICIGTEVIPAHNWHRNPADCLTVAERDCIAKKNKPFVDELKSELKREDGPLYQFDKSEWVLTPATIADLVAHIRMCKEFLESGLGCNIKLD